MKEETTRLFKLNQEIDSTIDKLFFHQDMIEVAIIEGSLMGLVYSKEMAKDYTEKFNKQYRRFCSLMDPSPTDITQTEIERAKEYPFEELIELNKMGWAICPFHSEKTPSFQVKKNNKGYCFGSCHETWDTISFVQKRDGKTFNEAVRWLCH